MMKLSWGRSGSKHRALGPRLGVLLVSLLVMGIAPRVRAQQDPPGCSGTGLTLNIFVERADGSNAGAGSAVSPCETLIYKGSLTGGSCPPSPPCLTSICDPTLQGTGADAGRMGLCTTTNVTDSTPCAADNAGNPVTAIPGSCKTPGCEAGECVRAHIPVTDSTACSADNAGNPVTAIPGSCKTPG